jgi:hypothetical protein
MFQGEFRRFPFYNPILFSGITAGRSFFASFLSGDRKKVVSFYRFYYLNEIYYRIITP